MKFAPLLVLASSLRRCSSLAGAPRPCWDFDKGSMSPQRMIEVAGDFLERRNVTDAKLSAAELLAVAVGYRGAREMREAVSMATPLSLSISQAQMFEELCQRRALHEPVQYLVGEWDWHNISLKVRPPVLIPRPETEEMVELVLEWLRSEADAPPVFLSSQECGEGGGKSRSRGAAPLRFLDVGSGTGAIGLALLSALPEASCIACDVNPIAVSLAKENANQLGLNDRYTCIQSPIKDLRKHIPDGTKFDFVVSNPPYIPEPDMPGLQKDVALYEDHGALCGGADGLDIVRDIVNVAPKFMDGGTIWLEVDATHPTLMESQWRREGSEGLLLGSSTPVQELEWHRDLSGKPRFVRLTL